MSAQQRRVAEIGKRLKSPEAFLFAPHFDEAAEFAALEGLSIAEAIADFLSELDPGGTPATELRALLKKPAVRDEFRLPIMPKAAARLLRTSDETTSAVELETIAATDQVLAARLLGAANSARFASRFDVTGVREAILRLGIPRARQELLAAGLGKLFASRPLQDLWEHSQHVAQAARGLAPACGVDSETAFAAGLLHDIGRLGFASYPVAARVEEQRWLEAGFPLVYAETLAHGEDHAQFGARLLSRWDVPAGIADAVALHHRPECSDNRLHCVLFLAENLVGGEAEDLWTSLRITLACERAGIDPESVLAQKTRETIGRACA